MIFNKQKLIIALVCSALGWGLGYQRGKSQAEKEFALQNQSLREPHFFKFPYTTPFDSPPDEGINSPPSLWDRFFGDTGSENEKDRDSSIFDLMPSFFGHRLGQPNMSQREDDHFVYIEIDATAFEQNSLSARVEGESVVVEGHQKSQEGGASVSSQFYQSLPVPMGTEPSKVDMLHENNKLILKFPKIKK